MATPTTNCAPRIEILFDRLPAMPDFSGEDDLAGLLMNNRDASRVWTGIDFQSEIGRLNANHLSLQNEREWVATKDGCFARFQKQSSAARRRRRQRFFGRV